MKTSGKPRTNKIRKRGRDAVTAMSGEQSSSNHQDAAGDVLMEGYKQTQDVLLASEIRYRRLFESAKDGILILNAETGQIDDANPFLTALLGYSREELLGKRIWEIGPLKNVAASRSAFLELRERGYIRYENLPLETRSGKPVQVEFVSNVYEADHKLVIQCNIRDITERVRVEAAERQQRTLAEALRDTAAILTGTLNLDEVLDRIMENVGRVVPYDTASIMLLAGDDIRVARCRGFGGDEVEKKMLTARFHLADIPNLQRMAETAQAHVMPLIQNESARLALPETSWIRSSVGAPIQLDKKVVGFLVLDSNTSGFFTSIHAEHLQAFANQAAIAIKNARLYYEMEGYNQVLEQTVWERTAELQNSKEHVEAILNSVGDALMVVAPDGLIKQVNPEFERQTGFPADEAVLHHFGSLLLAAGSPRQVFEQAAIAIRAGQGWRGQIVVGRRDGTSYDADVTISPLRAPTGEISAFVGSMRDISVLKDIERMKDTFVANVSHELRTPITSLKLYYTLLGMRPEKTDIYKDHMQRELRRLERIVEDLLDLSRLDHQKNELKLSQTDLNALVAQYVSDREPLAESAQLKLALSQDPGLLPISADVGKLGQVVGILMTNAFMYTPPGGHIMVTTLTRKNWGRTSVGFSVSDTGPGISPSEQPYIFTRFFRGKAGHTSGAPGTGLGLAIAKEIVERHHGEIDLQSEGLPGKGATFTVWLPAGQFA